MPDTAAQTSRRLMHYFLFEGAVDPHLHVLVGCYLQVIVS